jgi:hypothetical protein
LIAHVVFLALLESESGASIGNVFVPFWSESARSIDIIVFYLLLLLGGLAYDRRMSYERWLAVHRLTGLVFLGGAAHAAVEPGTIADFEPLRTWMVILILSGGAAWLWGLTFQPTRSTLSLPSRNGCSTRQQYHRSCDAPNGAAHDVRARHFCLFTRLRYERAAEGTSPFFHLLVTGGRGFTLVYPDSRRFHAPVCRRSSPQRN